MISPNKIFISVFLVISISFCFIFCNDTKSSKPNKPNKEKVSDNFLNLLNGKGYTLVEKKDSIGISNGYDWFLHINSCQWTSAEYESVSKKVQTSIKYVANYDVIFNSKPISNFSIWSFEDSVSAKIIYNIFQSQNSFSCIAEKVFAYMVFYKNILVITSCNVPCSQEIEKLNFTINEFINVK